VVKKEVTFSKKTWTTPLMDRFPPFFFKLQPKTLWEKNRFGENHPFWGKGGKRVTFEKGGVEECRRVPERKEKEGPLWISP
jgi:hypothetical protein